MFATNFAFWCNAVRERSECALEANAAILGTNIAMKKSASEWAARTALVFAAQMAAIACGDDDGGRAPVDDAGMTDPSSSETTDESSTDQSSGDPSGADASTGDETSSGSSTTGTDSAESDGGSESTSTDGGMLEEPDSGGGDSHDTDAGAQHRADAGGEGACYADEAPSTIDCLAYPVECDGAPYAFEACMYYEFVMKAEVFQAVFECYDAVESPDHCSEDAQAEITKCYDEVAAQACVGPIDACATLAEACTDMTAADCERIVSPYSALWLDVAAWPISEVSCMTPEGVGEGAGCGERLESCLAGLDEE